MKDKNKRISVDVIPKRLFANSEDWTGIYVSRSAVLPLLREKTVGTQAGVIEKTERLNSNSWLIRLNRSISNRYEINSSTILSSWRRLAKAHSGMGSLLRVMRKAQAIDPLSMRVEMAESMDDIQSYFAHPLLGVPIEEQEPLVSPATLTMRGTSGSEVTFCKYDNFYTAANEYEKGNLDALTGVGVPTTYWSEFTNTVNNCMFDTTLHVAIAVPSEYYSLADRIMNLPFSQLEEQTKGQFSATSYPSQEIRNNFEKEFTITYPDFPPNKEICAWLSKQLAEKYDIQLHCKEISYTDYLNNEMQDERVLRFMIETDPWAGPESILSLTFPRSNDNLNTTNPSHSKMETQSSFNVERAHVEGVVRIGRLRGLKITHLIHVGETRTGWIGWDDDLFYL